jgi:hypothetical protein
MDTRMVLRVSVPRWSIRSAKRMTGSPSGLRLMAFFVLANSDGSVGTIGEARHALAALMSVSWNSNGAS